MVDGATEWLVEFDGPCARCGRTLLRGTPAVWDRAASNVPLSRSPTRHGSQPPGRGAEAAPGAGTQVGPARCRVSRPIAIKALYRAPKLDRSSAPERRRFR